MVTVSWSTVVKTKINDSLDLIHSKGDDYRDILGETLNYLKLVCSENIQALLHICDGFVSDLVMDF